VAIYEGAKYAMSLRPTSYAKQSVNFVSEHLETEKTHLALFDKLLDPNHKSILLPLWVASGFALGFLPTFVGGESLTIAPPPAF